MSDKSNEARLPAGHPANHGYVQCADCGCWRPDKPTLIARVEGSPPRCFDVYSCKRWKAEREGRLQPKADIEPGRYPVEDGTNEC